MVMWYDLSRQCPDSSGSKWIIWAPAAWCRSVSTVSSATGSKLLPANTTLPLTLALFEICAALKEVLLLLWSYVSRKQGVRTYLESGGKQPSAGTRTRNYISSDVFNAPFTRQPSWQQTPLATLLYSSERTEISKRATSAIYFYVWGIYCLHTQ